MWRCACTACSPAPWAPALAKRQARPDIFCACKGIFWDLVPRRLQVKKSVKRLYERGQIDRGDFKAIAQSATRELYAPAKAALLAAVQPASTRALYFVAKGDGSSHFSTSLDEHNRAVNRYQRGQSQ